MLQVHVIKDHKEAYAKALKKRGLDATTILNQVLEADENRRATQTKLDEILAELNSLSKEIGALFKSGNVAEATVLKEKTSTLKEASKTLDEQLKDVSEALQNLLYTIPNIPNELVPTGQDENDNEETLREGDIPILREGSMPHREWAKKTEQIK